MEVNLSYEPYAEDPEYISTNREFFDTLDLEHVHLVLDLACGTGLISQLLLQRNSALAIRGVDISQESLDIGRRSFRERGVHVESETAWAAAARAGSGVIFLEESPADDLQFENHMFDLAVMGNAIHLMPDKGSFLRGVHRVLKPGGTFAFNSVFFVGTFADDTESFFLEWMKQALAVLGEINARREAKGEGPIPRRRGKGGRAFDKNWMTVEQWRDIVSDSGFKVTQARKRLTSISRKGLELVGAYGGLAEVLMSGYPVDTASECLQEAAGRTFDKLCKTEIGRYWLEVTAVKV